MYVYVLCVIYVTDMFSQFTVALYCDIVGSSRHIVLRYRYIHTTTTLLLSSLTMTQ